MDTATPIRTTTQVETLLAALPHGDEIPRECGDVAFDAPWELRALALGVAAHDAGSYPWPDFQHALIESIKRWEAAGSAGNRWQYYERWLDALERLLADRGLLDTTELDERTQFVLTTPRDASHQHAHPDPVAIDHGH